MKNIKKNLLKGLAGLTTTLIASLIITYNATFPKVRHSIATLPKPSELEEEIRKYSFPEPTEETQVIFLGALHCYGCEIGKEKFKKLEGIEIIYFDQTDETKEIRDFYEIDHYPQVLIQKGSESLRLNYAWSVFPPLPICKINIQKAIREIEKN